MQVYAGTVDSEGYIISYRPVYYKYEDSFIDAQSIELRDREVILPLNYPELNDVDSYHFVDGVLVDAEGVDVTESTTRVYSYREVKDTSDFTRFEWLEKNTSQLFEGSLYPLSNNPLLYFVDVVDELGYIYGGELLGELLHILPKTNLTPVIVSGKEAVQDLYTKFSKLYDFYLRVNNFITAYAEDQDVSMLPELDELMVELREYL